MTGSFDDNFARLDEAIRLAQEHRQAPSVTDDEFLTQHAEMRDLLEPLLTEDEGPDPDVSPRPIEGGRRHIGDFAILREIGHGGMGVVYLAEQVSLGRRVALKVLPTHLTRSATQVERFRREAAAAAKLRHPGIIPVYSVGEDDGTHFIAMEYVDGGTLADRATSLSSPKDLATLVAKIADALQHAHDHGVLHRDIKPQNILITTNGEPMVADFGLAKDLDQNSLTATGGFAGTPHYMSPEQITPGTQRIDFRTDVYSLGAVMYELLAGVTPFDGESSQEVLARVLHGTPRPLGAVAPETPRDLQTICHHALEREATDRYATAAAMAADLRRFVADDSILATPPTWPTRAVRYLRRRKVATVAVLLALVVLVGAPIGYSMYAEQKRRNFRQSVQGVNRVIDVIRQARIKQMPGKSKLHQSTLERGAAAYEDLLKQNPSDVELRFELIRTIANLAVEYAQIREVARAEQAFARAIKLGEELLAEYPQQPSVLGMLASTIYNRAYLLKGSRSTEQILADYRYARASFEHVIETDTANADVARREIANITFNIGDLLHSAGESAQAAPYFDEGMRWWEQQPEAIRKSEDARARLASFHHRRGHYFLYVGKFAASDAEYAKALEIIDELLANNRGHRDYGETRALALIGRAKTQHNFGPVLSAVAINEQAIAQLEELTAAFPSVFQFAALLASTTTVTGAWLVDLKQFQKAKPFLTRGLAMAEKLHGDHPDEVTIRNTLGLGYGARALISANERAPRADVLADFRRAAETFGKLLDRERWEANHYSHLGAILNNQGMYELQQKRAEPARKLGIRAVAAQTRARQRMSEYPRYAIYLARHHTLVARASLMLKDHATAVQHSDSVLQLDIRDPEILAHCGAIATHSIRVLRKNRPTQPSAFPELEERYGTIAVSLLKRSVDCGLKRKKMITTARDFVVLHHRDDFRQLVAAIRAAK